MKSFIKKSLAAKCLLTVTLLNGPVVYQPAYATGIPVVDVANLSQTTIGAVQEVMQTINQYVELANQALDLIEQVKQYENMVKNTLPPGAADFLWDKADNVMNKLVSSIDSLAPYKEKLGGLEGYLKTFQDSSYYKQLPCFSAGKTSCSEEELKKINEVRTNGSEAQKRANDAALRGVDETQIALKTDANQLERLQSKTQGAEGQMAAMQFNNVISSTQTNQLLQMRGLLAAQLNSTATRQADMVNREAIQQVADEAFRGGEFKKSPEKSW